MSVDISSIHVLVLDEFGSLTVCALDQLIENLLDEDLNELAPSKAQRAMVALAEKVRRLRALNETGDAMTYWSTGV